MGKEVEFQKKIQRYLEDNKCWQLKYWGGGCFTKSGIPDILACVNGYFVGIEVKASNGTPSELQLWNRRKIREAGGISIILYPSQFEDFKLLVNDIIERPHLVEWDDQCFFDKTK